MVNAGPPGATNLVVTDTLPDGLTLVGGGLPSGSGFTCNGVAGGTSFTCTRATQPVGTPQITFTAQLSEDAAPGQTFTNRITVSADQPDPNIANNASNAHISSPACTITATGNGATIFGTAGTT